MEVTIHGIDINLTDRKYKNVGEIIDFIEVNGHIVSKVIADEKDVTNFSAQKLEEIKPINSLVIFSKKVDDLLLESLNEAKKYIPRLISGIEDIVNSFSQGDEIKGYNLLTQCLEGLEWLNTLLISLKNNNLKSNLLEVDTINMEEFSSDWNEQIENLLSAIENQDLILLSDILEYEIVPLVEEYLEFIKKLTVLFDFS